MKLASTLCLAAASACALAAIWSPWGHWWQYAITALILALVGAGISGKRKPDDIEVHLHQMHEMTPEELAEELGAREPSAGGPREFGKKADQ